MGKSSNYTRIGCGCGEYSIEVSDITHIYDFGATCPECGNHFGWLSDIDAEQ